jgi:hypothetical protein
LVAFADLISVCIVRQRRKDHDGGGGWRGVEEVDAPRHSSLLGGDSSIMPVLGNVKLVISK